MVHGQTTITARKKKSKPRMQKKAKTKAAMSSRVTMSKDGRKYFYTEEEGLYQILE